MSDAPQQVVILDHALARRKSGLPQRHLVPAMLETDVVVVGHPVIDMNEKTFLEQ